jgi:hypothetical protein
MPEQDHAAALKLEYEYLREESIRLREGRASLTRQLGPLPIGAAIVAGLVTGFTSDVRGDPLFGLLSVYSSLSS